MTTFLGVINILCHSYVWRCNFDIFFFIELKEYISWVLEKPKKKEPYLKPTKVI